MRTEYWLFKEKGEDFLDHHVICAFTKEKYAKAAKWFLNKFGNEENMFYYSKTKVGIKT